MKPSVRTALALIFVPLGIALAIYGWIGPEHGWIGPVHKEEATELLFHGAAICFEIAIGVALVERLIESSREREELRTLAAGTLKDLLFFTWVWTGGTLYPDPGKTIAFLESISELDLMAPCTESLAVELARNAVSTLLIRENSINSVKNKDLYWAFVHLSALARLRNFDNTLAPGFAQNAAHPLQCPPPLSERRTATVVSDAAKELFLFLKLPPQKAQAFTPDMSMEAQEFRYQGRRRGFRGGSEQPSFLRSSIEH